VHKTDAASLLEIKCIHVRQWHISSTRCGAAKRERSKGKQTRHGHRGTDAIEPDLTLRIEYCRAEREWGSQRGTMDRPNPLFAYPLLR